MLLSEHVMIDMVARIFLASIDGAHFYRGDHIEKAPGDRRRRTTHDCCSHAGKT